MKPQPNLICQACATLCSICALLFAFISHFYLAFLFLILAVVYFWLSKKLENKQP